MRGSGWSAKAAPWLALVALLLAGCQIASAPPEISVSTTRTRGATSTPAAAPSPRAGATATAPAATAATRGPTPRLAPTATILATLTVPPAPTLARSPTAAGPTVPAPTVEPSVRPVVATPAPEQRPAGASPGPTAAAAPTFARATALPPPARTSAPANGLLPAGAQQLAGEVLSYAASARVLQVRSGGTTQDVSLAPGATIRRADGSVAAAMDLRAGQTVRLTVSRGADGALVASELTIVGPS